MSRKSKEPRYVKTILNNDMINYRVYLPEKGEELLVRLLLFLAGGMTALVFYGGLFKSDGDVTLATRISDTFFFCLLGIIANRFFFSVYLESRLEKRNRMLRNQFKDMLSALSASISAGSNVKNAFEETYKDLLMQYDESDMICLETGEIINGVNQNINVEELLRNFADRSGNEEIRCFADVFTICLRKGGDLKAVIRKTYDSIVEKNEVQDEIETKLTSNKMQNNVMSLMPVFVVAMLKYTNKTFADSFVTFSGVLINTIAIAVFIGAYLYGRKICEIEV